MKFHLCLLFVEGNKSIVYKARIYGLLTFWPALEVYVGSCQFELPFTGLYFEKELTFKVVVVYLKVKDPAAFSSSYLVFTKSMNMDIWVIYKKLLTQIKFSKK